MHFNITQQWPLLHGVVSAGVAAVTVQLWRLAAQAAHSIRDERIRRWVETLVRAAESCATSPSTGPEKKVWVIGRLRTLFPNLPLPIASDLVEAVVQGTKDAGR